MARGKIEKVIASGKDGIWSYHKFADHTYHAWYVGAVNLMTGTSFVGGYYHASKSSLTAPSFSQSVASLTGAPNSDILCAYLGHANDYSTYWLNGAEGELDNVKVRLDMYGTW